MERECNILQQAGMDMKKENLSRVGGGNENYGKLS